MYIGILGFFLIIIYQQAFEIKLQTRYEISKSQNL